MAGTAAQAEGRQKSGSFPPTVTSTVQKEETLTVTRLGIGRQLMQTLASKNQVHD